MVVLGSERFGEIRRGVPLISTAMLSARLRQLADRGVIIRHRERRGGRYQLTEAGWELYPIIEAMGVWGQRWARSRYTADELDPSLLMWDMRRMLRPEGLADRRSVIEIRFRGAPRGRSVFWLVVDEAIDLCLVDPDHEVDLRMVAGLKALTEVWMGDRSIRAAIDDGSIELQGRRDLVRRFPEWLGAHPVLGAVRSEVDD